MGDMGDDWRERDEFFRQRKDERRQENLQYLADHDVPWEWINKACDHILIRGEIDYYLGKTYWCNRRTRKSGHAMVERLEATSHVADSPTQV